MKTKEELNALKEDLQSFANKISELTDDELMQVTGGEELQQDYLVTKAIKEKLCYVAIDPEE